MLSEIYEDMKDDLMQRLSIIAERAYQKAIISRDYMNNTGNLRSSIGWGVFFNGNLCNMGGFVSIYSGTHGANEGEKILRGANISPIGYTIVLVAGMHYATFVEATGRDVSTSGEKLIELLLSQL